MLIITLLGNLSKSGNIKYTLLSVWVKATLELMHYLPNLNLNWFQTFKIIY